MIDGVPYVFSGKVSGYERSSFTNDTILDWLIRRWAGMLEWMRLCRARSLRTFVSMEKETFEALVAKAVHNLPAELQSELDNVDVVVEDWPTRRHLRQAKRSRPTQLLGLYQGVPRAKRGARYGLVLPDKITIFRKPIEAQCRGDDEVEATIEEVVRHEIGHHFGLDEQTLRKIESDKRRLK